MLAALMAVAQVAAGPPLPDAPRGQAVALRWDGETRGCVASVHGVDTGDPREERGRAALVAALPDRGAALRVAEGDGVPYACVADAITALRHAGYWGAIGLSAQPAP